MSKDDTYDLLKCAKEMQSQVGQLPGLEEDKELYDAYLKLTVSLGVLQAKEEQH